MCRKTAFRMPFGLTALFIFVFGIIAFFVQLVLYSLGNKYAEHSVYAALWIMGCGMIATGIYCFVLQNRSNKICCIIAGVTSIIPPVGTVMFAVLMARMRYDNVAEALVYNGYAFTLGAMHCFCNNFKLEFIDDAGEEEIEHLSRKERAEKFKELKKKATDPEGWFNYGAAIANYRAHAERRDAIRYLQKAAKADYAPALFNVGYCYETGYGVKRDTKKAHEYYRRAAENGDKDARIRLAIVAINDGKYDEGFETFVECANKGDACAKYNLAICYERGLGCERNIQKAFELYASVAKLHVAKCRIFALAADNVDKDDVDNIFAKIKTAKFDNEFTYMLKGAAFVRDRKAVDAADNFLEAVKCRGKWEGEARCFVGALYVDNGAENVDRIHGVQYIETAFKLTPIAKEVHSALPRSLLADVAAANKRTSHKPPTGKANMKVSPEQKDLSST